MTTVVEGARVGPRSSVYLVLLLALGAAIATGCSSGAAPAGSGAPAAASAPAATSAAAAGATAAGAANNPPPAAGGATTFHVVVADGPKAGTYDLSTSDPAACAAADVGYFVTTYADLTKSGLDYLSATLHPGNTTGLSYAFDANGDAKVNFVGTGGVTFDLNDQGSTASVHVVSDKNHGSQDADPQSFDTGKVDITVQCGSVLRPNS